MAIVALFAGLPVASERAVAEAAIGVELEAIQPVYWLDDVDWLITVTNPGTEPLTSVIIDFVEPGAPLIPTTLTGPVVVVGNADDVLDPGEQWSYDGRGFFVPAGGGTVTVTAMSPDAAQVTATDEVYPEAFDPVEISITTDTTAVVAGETVDWDVSMRNLTSTELLFGEGFGYLVLFPGSRAVPYQPVGEPVQQGADGDDTFGPGETWVWRHSVAVGIDGSYLEVRRGVHRPGFPLSGMAIAGQSDPMSVTAPPSPTVAPPTTVPPAPTDDLPATGIDGRLGPVALVLLVIGSTFVIVGRRRLEADR